MKTTLAAAGLASFVLIAGGCASAPDPAETQIVRAETSIENAAGSGVPEVYAKSIDEARDKLAQARTASENGDEELAARLAEEAELDAEVAVAKAEAAEAEAALQEVQEGIQTLRRELQQGTYRPGGT